ncbi:peptidoglycan-binding protein [Pedobacter gandavensis]|uniref:peptidoglycan-binding protein n=1 Tax=Pedobacter gandavensis TaxID=2679963 RepID=UPI00292CC36D|nr:peptidoglycan-binding protein [Pedobacter gandavensis]
MAASSFFSGLLWIAFAGSYWLSERSVLKHGSSDFSKTELVAGHKYRLLLVKIAQGELGLREKTGRNDGERIAEFLAKVGLKKPEPWCAAFISWTFFKAGFERPRSGWSPDLFPDARLVKSALPGNVIGIYFPEKKRIAHVGLIEKGDGDWLVSLEGNTNLSGSREGDGVYRKRRHRKSVYKIADWLSNGRRMP